MKKKYGQTAVAKRAAVPDPEDYLPRPIKNLNESIAGRLRILKKRRQKFLRVLNRKQNADDSDETELAVAEVKVEECTNFSEFLIELKKKLAQDWQDHINELHEEQLINEELNDEQLYQLIDKMMNCQEMFRQCKDPEIEFIFRSQFSEELSDMNSATFPTLSNVFCPKLCPSENQEEWNSKRLVAARCSVMVLHGPEMVKFDDVDGEQIKKLLDCLTSQEFYNRVTKRLITKEIQNIPIKSRWIPDLSNISNSDDTSFIHHLETESSSSSASEDVLDLSVHSAISLSAHSDECSATKLPAFCDPEQSSTQSRNAEEQASETNMLTQETAKQEQDEIACLARKLAEMSGFLNKVPVMLPFGDKLLKISLTDSSTDTNDSITPTAEGDVIGRLGSAWPPDSWATEFPWPSKVLQPAELESTKLGRWGAIGEERVWKYNQQIDRLTLLFDQP